MALAKKCDRCGKLYEHYSDFNSCNTMIADRNGNIDKMSGRKDLCPDCMQELTDFLEAPQREVDNSKGILTPETYDIPKNNRKSS